MREVAARLRAVPHLRAHLLLSAGFLISRLVVDLLGLRFNFALDWMFLADPADLRDHLLHTLYYSHGFPPGMNVIAGLALKLGQPAAINAVHALFLGFGLILVNSMFYLGRAVGLSARVSFALAGAFALTPGTLYFEHLFLYESPVVGLLCLAAALFHHALRTQSFRAWLGCFAVCAVIGWIRSMFHLVWLVALIGLAVWSSPAGARRRVLGAASGPTAALLALYLKNYFVFGVFGALTFGPFTFTTVTVRNLPAPVRQAWVAEGKISPYATKSAYAGPREFLPFFPNGTEDPKWPLMMNQLDRPSLGVPNFNHWFFLEINPRRMADARYYVSQRPGEYANTVLLNVPEYLSAITGWHPFDKDERSPHWKHRQVLGAYERAYNGLMHGFPAPVGVQLLLPLVLGWALLHVRSQWRAGGPEQRARALLIGFWLVQIAFVTATGLLLSYGEGERYRYQIEPFLWILAALGITTLWRRAGAAAAQRRLRRPDPLYPPTSRSLP
jgi:hypothetical protein